MQQIFSYKLMDLHSQTGRITITSFAITYLLGSLILKYIVERSKKCLDHSATVTVVHFFIVCFYSGFPRSLAWWGVNLIGMVVMAMFGEYLCMRRELRDIPLSRAKELDSTPIANPFSPTFNSNSLNGIALNNLNRNIINNNNNNNNLNSLNSLNSNSNSNNSKSKDKDTDDECEIIHDMNSSNGSVINSSKKNGYMSLSTKDIP
ncbi:hypothetical protein CYY_000485 [Polysphondylium violaceum]|uniref:Uncharacterized protein n=1 Tax=Polysphondylium violaceum TaxID=133409 RepID=A0A8J4V2D1_9MYCE|nr:hypothetical protein CYY_000485 [Polysphondylium violaceum]